MSPFEFFPLRNGIGARIAFEHVIKAAILLHDEDDVLDLAGARRVERSQRRIALHGRERRVPGAENHNPP